MDLDSGRNESGAMGESMQPTTPSRHEKSLGLLTTKFVTLLQEAKDGVLDLKAVSVMLASWLANTLANSVVSTLANSLPRRLFHLRALFTLSGAFMVMIYDHKAWSKYYLQMLRTFVSPERKRHGETNLLLAASHTAACSLDMPSTYAPKEWRVHSF